MARDKVTYESYEQDVFDNPPKGPVGVHRGSRSVISRIAPFVIVILVAALCGFGAWAWVTGEYKNILNLNTSSQTAQTPSPIPPTLLIPSPRILIPRMLNPIPPLPIMPVRAPSRIRPQRL